MVWHFCQAQDVEKLEILNKRILRFIFRTGTVTMIVYESGPVHSAWQIRELAI